MTAPAQSEGWHPLASERPRYTPFVLWIPPGVPGGPTAERGAYYVIDRHSSTPFEAGIVIDDEVVSFDDPRLALASWCELPAATDRVRIRHPDRLGENGASSEEGDMLIRVATDAGVKASALYRALVTSGYAIVRDQDWRETCALADERRALMDALLKADLTVSSDGEKFEIDLQPYLAKRTPDFLRRLYDVARNGCGASRNAVPDDALPEALAKELGRGQAYARAFQHIGRSLKPDLEDHG